MDPRHPHAPGQVRRSRLWAELQAENVPRLAGVFAGVLTVSGVLVYFLERGRNPAFRTVGDGLWWSLVTLTTIGYGDVYPVTARGRLLAAVVILSGLGLVGIVTGKIAGALVQRRMKEGRGLGEAHGLKGHLVVVGWKAEMARLVEGLLAAQAGLAPERIVLVNLAGEIANEELRGRFPGLGYVHGDAVEPSVLERARVREAQRVVVLADEAGGRSDQEVDARTVMTVMNVESLAPDVYVCAEVLDRKFLEPLRIARCDEVVLSRDHARAMLVSASASTGLAPLLERLLAPGHGLQTVAVPPAFVGRSFGELATHLRDEAGQLAIGLIENTGHVLVIKREALRAAQKTEDVSALLDNLRAVRELVPNEPILNPPPSYLVKPHTLAVVLGAREARP